MKANVEGRDLMVTSGTNQVADPMNARHGWSDIGFIHLYTESGLPVEPFRTDDFPASSAHM